MKRAQWKRQTQTRFTPRLCHQALLKSFEESLLARFRNAFVEAERHFFMCHVGVVFGEKFAPCEHELAEKHEGWEGFTWAR